MIRITKVSCLSERIVVNCFAGKLRRGFLEARGRPSGVRRRVARFDVAS